jgi:2'-hydroxyisoflavone reductase
VNHKTESSRRAFIKAAAATAALAGLSDFSKVLAQPQGEADKKLNILILGGTGFLGPHTVRAALARGHDITLFNRGKTNDDLFPQLETLYGDRNGNLEALKGRDWDAVIDTSAYYPRVVRDSAGLLKGHIGQYVLISTISVYGAFVNPGMDETAPVGTIEDETVEQVTGETYGPLKALCEKAAEETLPGIVTNIRPGLIVGPGDPTDRFTYWPVRVSKGGEVLAPGDGSTQIQQIDVRDLADFIIHTIERNITGVFNADSPMGQRTMKELLTTCKKVSGSDASFVWVDAEFLAEQGIRPWQDMPCWIPQEGDYAAFGRVSSAKAIANGLKCRPLTDTVRATLDWWETLPEERRARMRAGLTSEREEAALAAWHDRG